MSSGKVLQIVDYDETWPTQFEEVRRRLSAVLGEDARAIDHVGSTSVPGLAAKDVIDVQVTVVNLGVADRWPDELLPGLVRKPMNDRDHLPAGLDGDEAQWSKRMWSQRQQLHVHVREAGRLNQRYALLFRDYLRADPAAAGAYASVKRALAAGAPDDWDTYYAVKDPACDLIVAGAEHWAARTGWTRSSREAASG